jgi:hypothetical protein
VRSYLAYSQQGVVPPNNKLLFRSSCLKFKIIIPLLPRFTLSDKTFFTTLYPGLTLSTSECFHKGSQHGGGCLVELLLPFLALSRRISYALRAHSTFWFSIAFFVAVRIDPIFVTRCTAFSEENTVYLSVGDLTS